MHNSNIVERNLSYNNSNVFNSASWNFDRKTEIQLSCFAQGYHPGIRVSKEVPSQLVNL
jgi:hypothetical protein